MRKSTRFMLAVPLLSIFAAASVSALAADAKKSGHATSATKTHGSSKSSSAGGKGNIGADVANGAVNGAVGGAINGAVGGLLGAFGPR